MATQSSITFPSKYTPGTTSNFSSNEVIAANLSAAQIWPLLSHPSKWPSYYWNSSQITPPKDSSTLSKDAPFSFSTFGFPPLPCVVRECTPPTASSPGYLAWEAETEGEDGEKLSVYHAWLVEDLSGGRVRILTQESQCGGVFVEFSKKKPNPMVNGHQDWCDGLVAAARGEKSPEPGEWSKEFRS